MEEINVTFKNCQNSMIIVGIYKIMINAGRWCKTLEYISSVKPTLKHRREGLNTSFIFNIIQPISELPGFRVINLLLMLV